MKTFVLCGIAAMMVAPAFAQSSADPANKTVTLTGCVGSSADASGFTLSDAVVVPGYRTSGSRRAASEFGGSAAAGECGCGAASLCGSAAQIDSSASTVYGSTGREPGADRAACQSGPDRPSSRNCRGRNNGSRAGHRHTHHQRARRNAGEHPRSWRLSAVGDGHDVVGWTARAGGRHVQSVRRDACRIDGGRTVRGAVGTAARVPCAERSADPGVLSR